MILNFYFSSNNKHELGETIVNDLFVLTHQMNDEVVDKPDSLCVK